MRNSDELYDDEDSLVPKDITTYYLGLIRRGEVWSPDVTPESEALQEAHQAHIRKMFDTGSLVVAGPFTDDGDLRGVFLFRTETLEDARLLSDGDPAVKAGRLIVDIHPWLVPAGILP